MSNIILGENLRVLDSGGTLIAAATDCVINVETEMIETATTTSYRQYYPGLTGWIVSVGFFVTNTTAQGKGTLVTLTLNGSTLGTAYVQKWSISGTVGSLSKGSLVFQGTGPIDESAT